MSYLDYYKGILNKVNFDKQLWEKEYAKALELLTKEQASDLEKWADRFSVQPVKKPSRRELKENKVFSFERAEK